MAPELFVELSIVWLFFGIISYAIARNKGYDGVKWVIFGLCLGILGFVFLLLPNCQKDTE